MRKAWIGTGGAIIMALIALAPRSAAAQANPFDRPDAPALVTGFGGGGGARALEQEFQADLYALGAFAGKRRLDRFDSDGHERPQPWTFYGRLGPMHFQNQMEYGSSGTQFSFRRQGPSLGGRVYIGIHKTF
jgi:hypothetical protein